MIDDVLFCRSQPRKSILHLLKSSSQAVAPLLQSSAVQQHINQMQLLCPEDTRDPQEPTPRSSSISNQQQSTTTSPTRSNELSHTQFIIFFSSENKLAKLANFHASKGFTLAYRPYSVIFSPATLSFGIHPRHLLLFLYLEN